MREESAERHGVVLLQVAAGADSSDQIAKGIGSALGVGDKLGDRVGVTDIVAVTVRVEVDEMLTVGLAVGATQGRGKKLEATKNRKKRRGGGGKYDLLGPSASTRILCNEGLELSTMAGVHAMTEGAPCINY